MISDSHWNFIVDSKQHSVSSATYVFNGSVQVTYGPKFDDLARIVYHLLTLLDQAKQGGYTVGSWMQIPHPSVARLWAMQATIG